MHITIIGAGAIGGTVGAHLVRSGHGVLLCDTDRAHVEAINADGLTIEGPVESFTVDVEAVTPDALPDRVERAAIAVKAQHTADAAALLRERLAPSGYAVTLQNGLTTDVLAAAVGATRVLASFVNFGADLLAPGRILQGNVATVRVGEPDGAPVTPRVSELARALPYAEATDNILGYLWGKEAYGAMLWAGAVSDLSIAESLGDPRWAPLMIAVAREVLAQAPVRPESFDGFEPDDLEGSLGRLAAFNRRSAKSHSGIYRDLAVRRRRTEVDEQLGCLAGPLTGYIAELIHAIERGERRCEVANLELLAAYERTERLGRRLHAVVRVLPVPRRSADGPLSGTPVAVKDLISVGGSPLGNGNPGAMAGPPAPADAPVVAFLRAAGADVFATTSLLEYAAGALHPAVPEAMNPYDPQRTAGGSSGGSAAMVGVGACPVALGTDTGGSIRIPAAYCGVVGLKPSFGALPVEGVQALAPSLDHVGLLTIDVAAATRTMTALTGGRPLAPPPTLRLGVVDDHFAHRALTTDVAEVLAATVDRLASASDVVHVDGSPFSRMLEVFEDILLWEAWQVHRDRVEQDPAHYGPETLRLLVAGSQVTRAAFEIAVRRRAELLPATLAAYTGTDVLVTPAAPYVAPVTTPPVDTPEGADEAVFTAAYNLTGAPAVVLPCGLGSGGLPVGLQLSALPGGDMALLAAAAQVEALIGVWRPVAKVPA